MPDSQLRRGRVDSSEQKEMNMTRRLLFFSAAIVVAVVLLVLILFSTSWIQIAIAIIPTTLVLYLVMSQLYGNVFSPVTELAEQTKRLADGDLTRSVHVGAEGDIGKIASNVNTVLVQLREKNERLRVLESSADNLQGYRSTANELKLSYDNLLVVSELGQQIISSLKLDDIASRLYETLNTMMDAAKLEVGIVEEMTETLHISLSMDRHIAKPPYSVPLRVQTTFSGWVVNHGKEVFLNNATQNYTRYLNEFDPTFARGELPHSIMCVPMFTKGAIAGVITVASNRPNAYTNYHLDMVKSLALYVAVALDNANAYHKLDNAMKDLKTAERQLIQSEKMSSLGLLTAGIAHEINNPINFVSANINPLRRNLREVLEIFRSYQQLSLSKDIANDLSMIKDTESHLDLEYTLREITALLDGIEEGAKRTADIVLGLRNFSRTDEHTLKMADVHEGIDSTLMLLHSRYKGRVEIIKEYGKVPEVECMVGQLNQVYMNILSNAIQAIPENGTICIKTNTTSQGDIEIHFKDSGTGMNEEVRKHIFDPFFTTKDVGVGTGLGLSISYGIIKKHNGDIEVLSEPGSGTEFIIRLPLRQPSNKLPVTEEEFAVSH